MISCMPRGICSWQFDLRGERHRADLEFSWAGEHGTIHADGKAFGVRKLGFLSGNWSLERTGEVHASAQKSSALTRSFELRSPMGSLVLRPESMFRRAFVVECSGVIVARIRPTHPFTRRATIDELTEPFDWPTICFSFWLTALMWRRMARSS